MGDIEVHENASIWPGAVLRAEMGRIIVRRNAAVLDRAVIHGGGVGAISRATEIGEDSVIGVGAMVHAMSAGRHTRIGANATVLEAASVGDWCWVEPRAVVLPRAVVPHNSIVSGIPGLVVGQIDEWRQRLMTVQGYNLLARAKLHRDAETQLPAREGDSPMIRSVNGKTPKISPLAWVSEAAYVVGDVEIGDYCTIFPGAVVRGDMAKIVIGARTNVQDNAVITADQDLVIGENTTIGHAVTIHGRRVGSHCLVGNNSTVSEGAEVGDYCVVAAGAAVAPNAKVLDDSFVAGVPAEVLWRTEPERRRQLEESGGENYARLSQVYQAEGLGSWPPGGAPPFHHQG
jgi:carbonic anhydrase/acetyltransferase-like protein (isoleucine patch superfamily)